MDVLVFIFGIFIGILSGLIPGLHSNTVIAILSSFGLGNEAMGAIIVALFSSHLVTSFIPSIFFGIPSDSSIVSVLPGQRMVREGKGITALKVVLASVLLSTLVCVAVFSTSLSVFPMVYSLIKPYVGYLLVLFSLALIANSRDRFLTLGIFLLSGILGAFSFGLKMYDVFLPLFSGFFAMASILNYEKGARIPKQKEEKGAIGLGFLKYALLGILLGFFADLLPGIGAPSQIATLATLAVPINTVGYLATISSISASEAIFSFSTSASIGKSRMGATEWLGRYVDLGTNANLAYVLVLFLVSIAITAAALYLARKAIGKIAEIDFSKLNILIALYLVGVVFVLNGLAGILVLALSSALGYATIRLNVQRTTLMGAIIVPTILLLFRVFVFM